MKKTKLMREVDEIIDDPNMHFWIKCKHLTKIKTDFRPGTHAASPMIRDFFETCAGRLKERFDSAYARPYLDNWRDDHNAHDYVIGKDLNNNLTCKIGRRPRGITNIAKKPDGQKRFANYIRAKYPDAFEEFEEIKKIDYHYDNGSAMEKTNDCAWQHIFGARVSNRSHYAYPYVNPKEAWQTPKGSQLNRRGLDLAMEKAQADYNALKKASWLPPRYLYNEVSLGQLQDDRKNHTYAIFNKHYIVVDTVLEYDNSQVGFGLGRLSRTSRKLHIRNKAGVVWSKELKSYAGNFVLNAIEEYFGKVKKVTISAKLKPVQLNPKMGVVKIADSNGFEIFKRLFAGESYDCCALKNNITYHGESVKKCIAGWEKKKRILKPGATILNMRMLKEEFGFCNDGIRSFCLANHLDRKDNYTVEEVKVVVGKKLSYNKAYYGRELKQLGIL